MALSCLTYEVRRPLPWNTFAIGLAIDTAGLLLLIIMGAHLSTWIPQERDMITRSTHVTLVAPMMRPQIETRPRIAAPVQMAKVEAPTLVTPPVPRVTIPERRVEMPRAEPLPAAASLPPARVATPLPRPEVKTNVFGSAKSETATVRLPARQVQTGGFGDPNGLPGQGDPKRNGLIAVKMGSFALPTGPGQGNGTGGSRGVSGTIRSAGFSTAKVASPVAQGDGRGVASSGFGTAVAQGTSSETRTAEKRAELQPVQITFKPRPAYTPEARRKRVEGEVLIDVVFNASGSLRINRVVKGLGYGLDEKALAAAERIQFRPARRDGQPYDCAALVHIVFALAD